MKKMRNQMNMWNNGRTGFASFAVLPTGYISASIAGRLRCVLSI